MCAGDNSSTDASAEIYVRRPPTKCSQHNRHCILAPTTRQWLKLKATLTTRAEIRSLAVGSVLNKAIAFTRIFGSTDFFFAKMACTIISRYSNMVRMFHSSKKQCFGEVKKFCFFVCPHSDGQVLPIDTGYLYL